MLVDQQNSDGGIGNGNGFLREFYTSGFTNVGQSFTPTLAAIDTVRLVLGADSPATYRLDLHAGAGLNGAVLGSAPAQPVLENQPVTFSFPAPIVLTPGSAYTFQIVRETGTGLVAVRISGGNRYAGGSFYTPNLSGGDATRDLDFVEGITLVPEPTSLVALAGVALVATRRRTRH